MFRAHHNFDPEEPNDIPLRVGDIVTNVEYLDNGWSIGYNVHIKSAGIFPRRYVRPINEVNFSLFKPLLPRLRPEFTEEIVEEYKTSPEIAEGPGRLNLTAFKEAYRKVVLSNRDQHPLLKGIVGFFAGVLLGVLTFIGCHYALKYEGLPAAVIALVSGLMLIIGLSFSTKCRAIVSLCIPTLFHRSGRFMFSTLAISLLLVGPIGNITKNSTELASVSGCVGEVITEQANILKLLAERPYKALVASLRQTVNTVKSQLETINNILKPLQEAAENIKNIVKTVNEQLLRVKNQCITGLLQANTQCVGEIREASAKCSQFLSQAARSFGCATASNQLQCTNAARGQARDKCNLLNDQLCNPVKLVKGACDNLILSADITDFTDAIDKLKKNLETDVKFSDTLEGGVSSNSSASDIASKIKMEVEERTQIIEDVIKYTNIVLSLTVILVIVQAYLYLRKYMKDDSFDNKYITDTFIEVDNKRAKKNKTSLMPLAPPEQKLVTDKRECRMSNLEKKNCCKGVLPLFVKVICGVALILFDHFLYWAILVSVEHGDVKIELNQNIDLGVKVEDGGFLSSYLQNLIGNLNAQSQINQTIDFSVCLPSPSRPNWMPVIGLSVIYVFLLTTVLLEAYSLRLRHAIAGYYYPERSKDRIKQFHRSLLRRRIITLKELKDVLKLKREQLETREVAKDSWDDIKSMCGCLRIDEECYICGKIEDDVGLEKCALCYSNFCQDCWHIMLHQSCPCDPNKTLSYDPVTESDFEDNMEEKIAEEYSYAAGLADEPIDHRRMNRMSIFDRQFSSLQ